MNTKNLGDLIEEGRTIQIDEIRNVFIKILTALKELRSKGMGINGLFNPDGILLNGDGSISFQDVTSIKGPFSNFHSKLLPINCVIGELEPRADIIGLGFALYELVTGKSPFSFSSDNNVIGKIRSFTDFQYPKLKDLRADCPEWLNLLILKEMSEEPFKSAEEMLSVFESKENI